MHGFFFLKAILVTVTMNRYEQANTRFAQCNGSRSWGLISRLSDSLATHGRINWGPFPEATHMV